jgi:lysophospholipase L1-like esterase
MRKPLFPVLASLVATLLSGLVFMSCVKRVTAPSTPIPPTEVPVTTDLRTYLALGDSYTIGQSVPVIERFPVQVVSLLRALGVKVADPEIIATTGWTTGNLLQAVNAIPSTKRFDVVTLLIGVNNQYQGRSLNEYREEFTTLLEKAIALTGGNVSKVVVISIPDYSVTPYAESSDRQKIANEIDAFNMVNSQVATQYKVTYVDVTAESRKAANDPSLVALDRLHFSGKEYRVWAELLLPVMHGILK